MTSTLVETVSINYEDFNDSFLTCGTCLCVYDALERTPKLLPCSHTVCKTCLERITEAPQREPGTFRCPICRETIPIPRGGVMSFPPSFLVNQLLDLMAQQRRDIVPKCSQHTSQQLLFCETCDIVFCTTCTGGEHSGRGASEHTVIPFSIAIKRMSEILLYKAQLCNKNLSGACENVSEEMQKLEVSYDNTIDVVRQAFAELRSLVDQRENDVLNNVQRVRDEKKKVLQEQLEIIQAEKSRVRRECQGLEHQVEVRNITKKISDLNSALDSTSVLGEPRENSHMGFEYKTNAALRDLKSNLKNFGRIRVSTTFPALCTAVSGKTVTHLRSCVNINTVDYHGNPRTTGCDPIVADLRNQHGDIVEASIKDNGNGTYSITFIPTISGKHKLSVSIFDRPIKDSPYYMNIIEHNNPVLKFGSRGSGNLELMQPVGVAVGRCGVVYVLDTGNSRIKALTRDWSFSTHIGRHGLENQSGIGLAVSPSNTLVVVNWRTKYVTELGDNGVIVNKFTNDLLEEPMAVAVNSRGHYIVADNGAGRVFVFDTNGGVVSKFGTKGDKTGQFKLISSVAIGRRDEIIVADSSRLQIFSEKGQLIRCLPSGSNVKGQYGGVTVDSAGFILATRTEKGKGVVQVFSPSGNTMFTIDSIDDKLKRPSGLAVTEDSHVIVADLGNDCIKKFRYR